MDETERKIKKLVRIRVEADPVIVEDFASKISEFLETSGYEVIDQSVAYPNRQDPGASRIYVTVR